MSGQNFIKYARFFWKPEACRQTVLPERSILIGQKLVENAKIEKLKYDIKGKEDYMALRIVQSIKGML